MKINEITSLKKSTLFRDLKWLKPVFAHEAQKVYDAWVLPERDRGKSGNGICDDISEKITRMLNKIDHLDAQAESVGRNKAGTHAYVVVFNDLECYGIDIPYWKYEEGRRSYGTMQWRKIEGVTLTENDVRIFKIKRLPWMDNIQ